ncbi:unnamed protein product [Rotaria sordida]|uniref:WSC domain-containing protein n=2 Tax=Rotaria sordida TaxID=392033 RepID=A0A815UR81_9BILA|nr:unnamed protein product [Rotaria sordida]
MSDDESINEDDTEIPSLRFNVNINRSSINEFQLINSNEMNDSTRKNNSCLVFTRTIINDKESSILKNTQMNNCSKPRHVLCITKPIINRQFEKGCFHKPLTLGVPVMISKHLTYELCLLVCKELETNLVILHINRCYCLNAAVTWLIETMRNSSKYRKIDCGNPCPGNKHEQCGDENTIVIFYKFSTALTSESDSDSSPNRLDKPNPDFVFDGCVNLNSVNQLTTYQFSFKRTIDIHPRHCLELCTSYKQKYALLNSNKCLCTNVSPKKKKNNHFTNFDSNCTRECPANYFYTCGNTTKSSLYSMYTMELNCPADKVKRRCIYTNTYTKAHSFFRAKTICKSKGGMLAKINDISTIQDFLSSSAFTFNHISSYSSSQYSSNPFERKTYFWINRTFNIIDNNKTLDRPIGRYSETSESIDENCIVLRYQKISVDHMASYERCFTESDECSSESAIPVCVDKHLGSDPSVIPSINDNNSSITSIHTLIDYSCGIDQDYHLMDEYCYKIYFHETTWQDAKAECERDNAILFIPEKTIILKMIKLLFLRRRSYTSSGVVHVGFIYNNKSDTVIKYNTKNGEVLKNSTNFDSIYYKCRSEFRRRYQILSSSWYLSKKEKDQ